MAPQARTAPPAPQPSHKRMVCRTLADATRKRNAARHRALPRRHLSVGSVWPVSKSTQLAAPRTVSLVQQVEGLPSAAADRGCRCAPELQPLGAPLDPHGQMHSGPCLHSLDSIVVSIPDLLPQGLWLPAELLWLDHSYIRQPRLELAASPGAGFPQEDLPHLSLSVSE